MSNKTSEESVYESNKDFVYQCLKCSNKKYKVAKIHMTGGFWSKIFDIQSQRFVGVTCSECGYTEFYKRDKGSIGGGIFDFFIGN